ncbi:hypothetical protein PMAYCL1PPCAC_33066, partial [Pristionchus mayeri]
SNNVITDQDNGGLRKRKRSPIPIATRSSARLAKLKSGREPFGQNQDETKDLAPIMWSIIDLVHEDVFALRSASPYLRDRVDEYIMLRPPLPVCTVLRIYDDLHIPDSDPKVKMEAYVQRRNAKLFDLRMLNQSSIDVVDRVNRHGDPVSVSYKREWRLSDANDDVLEHMRDCLGPRVGKLDLYVHDWQTLLAKFFKVFENLRVRKLAMLVGTMSNPVRSRLLSIVDTHKVEHLMITVRAVTAANPVKVLIDLSAIVRTLHIVQWPLPWLVPISDAKTAVKNRCARPCPILTRPPSY